MTASGDGEHNSVRWPEDIFSALKDCEISQVSFVPDAGHTRLIDCCLDDNMMKTTRLTTEQEGVALALGAWLGGERSVLLMQSSGVGNCINMLSILHETRSPFLMVVTMRGEWGEFNPWQVPMGQGTAAVLRETGAIVYEVDEEGKIGETVEAAARIAFGSSRVVAVLIGQRVIGYKNWRK